MGKAVRSSACHLLRICGCRAGRHGQQEKWAASRLPALPLRDLSVLPQLSQLGLLRLLQIELSLPRGRPQLESGLFCLLQLLDNRCPKAVIRRPVRQNITFASGTAVAGAAHDLDQVQGRRPALVRLLQWRLPQPH